MRAVVETVVGAAIGAPVGLVLALFVFARVLPHLPAMVAAATQDHREYHDGNAQD